MRGTILKSVSLSWFQPTRARKKYLPKNRPRQVGPLFDIRRLNLITRATLNEPRFILTLRVKSKARLCEGIHIVDSPQRNPKGCQKVAGGRSPRRPPEKSLVMTAPRRGARRQVNVKGLCREGSGTPPGCDPINLAFPVVSADSDHRLLSLQPFGLLSTFWLKPHKRDLLRHKNCYFDFPDPELYDSDLLI